MPSSALSSSAIRAYAVLNKLAGQDSERELPGVIAAVRAVQARYF